MRQPPPPSGGFFSPFTGRSFGDLHPDTALKENESSTQVVSDLRTHGLAVTWPPIPPPVKAQSHRNGALREQRASIRQSLDRHGMQAPSLSIPLRQDIECQSTRTLPHWPPRQQIPPFFGSCCLHAPIAPAAPSLVAAPHVSAAPKPQPPVSISTSTTAKAHAMHSPVVPSPPSSRHAATA